MDKNTRWLLEEKYLGIKSDEFEKDLLRLKSGEPLAYVIGWVPFLGTKIWLDSKPLIPRPETEYWVEKVIKEIFSTKEARNVPLKILDLCSGSGCIGVAILKHTPDCEVHFAEIVDDHHQTIRKNIRSNGIDVSRTKQIGGDLFENVSEKYDYILTNPPYIDPKLSNRIESSVSDFEPENALFGGMDGLEIIEGIIAEAPKHLNSGGVLFLEHEPEQLEAIKKLCPQSVQYEDQFKVIRFSRITF